MRNLKVSKIIALAVLVTFTSSSIAWSAPISPSIQPFSSQIRTQDGIKVPDLTQMIEIPETIGSIHERYVPNQKVDGYSQHSSPVIIHIQDAHGSYQAQTHIKEILEHLTKTYDIDLVFLEGGVGKVDPNLLRFFKDDQKNLDLADVFVKEGLVGGAEVFLLQEDSKKAGKVDAYGVEEIEFYRKNLEAYREVYSKRQPLDQFLKKTKTIILTKKSHVFNKALSDFFKEWMFYQDTSNEMLAHLKTLEKFSKQELKIDLSDARQQLDWPELVRIVKLEELEAELKGIDLTEEKTKLLQWAEKTKLDKNSLGALKEILDKREQNLQKDVKPRAAMEHFYEAAAPKGFSFKDYPNLSKYFGTEILKSELNSSDLFAEVERLTARLLDQLAKTKEEKELLEIYQDYLLLTKLFMLELTRDEFIKLQKKENDLKPSTLIERIQKIAITKNSPETQQGNVAPVLEAKDVDHFYEEALNFYEIAHAREQVMFEKMLSKMKETGKTNAILVTGGFHSEGLKDQMKEKGISYAIVSPRISELTDDKTDKTYEYVMTLRGLQRSETSQVTPLSLGKYSVPSMTNLFGKNIAAYFRSEVKDILRRTAKASAETIQGPAVGLHGLRPVVFQKARAELRVHEEEVQMLPSSVIAHLERRESKVRQGRVELINRKLKLGKSFAPVAPFKGDALQKKVQSALGRTSEIRSEVRTKREISLRLNRILKIGLAAAVAIAPFFPAVQEVKSQQIAVSQPIAPEVAPHIKTKVTAVSGGISISFSKPLNLNTRTVQFQASSREPVSYTVYDAAGSSITLSSGGLDRFYLAPASLRDHIDITNITAIVFTASERYTSRLDIDAIAGSVVSGLQVDKIFSGIVREGSFVNMLNGKVVIYPLTGEKPRILKGAYNAVLKLENGNLMVRTLNIKKQDRVNEYEIEPNTVKIIKHTTEILPTIPVSGTNLDGIPNIPWMNEGDKLTVAVAAQSGVVTDLASDQVSISATIQSRDAGIGVTGDYFGTAPNEIISLNGRNEYPLGLSGTGPARVEIVSFHDETDRAAGIETKSQLGIVEPLNPDQRQLVQVPLTTVGPQGGNLELVRILFFVNPENKPLSLSAQVTQSVPPVPEGWARAASNPNFAFQVDIQSYPNNGGDYYVLKLLNLITGETQTLASGLTTAYFKRPTVYDTNGSVVIYDIPTLTAQPNRVYVQSVANPTVKATIDGVLSGIVFNADNTATLMIELSTFSSGTVLEKTQTVQLDTLEISSPIFKLVTAGTGLYIDQDTPIVVQPEQVPSSQYQTRPNVFIYDSTQGLEHLSLIEQVGFGLDTSAGTYPLIDAYTTPAGNKIVSLGYDSDHFNETVVDNPETHTSIRFNGAATTVTYNGNIAVYTTSNQDGTTNQVTVDLERLGIIVPGAYGNSVALDMPGENYEITANGVVLTQSNEVSKVDFLVYNNITPRSLSDYIDTGLAGLQPGEAVTLTDYQTSRLGGNFEPMETIPNFVEINGKFNPQVTVTRAGSTPLGWPIWQISFTAPELVPELMRNGRDKVKFLSPYPYHGSAVVLKKEFAVSANGSMTAYFGCFNYNLGSASYVTFTGENLYQPFSTGLPEGTQVLDFYFNEEGTQFIIEIPDQVVTVNPITGEVSSSPRSELRKLQAPPAEIVKIQQPQIRSALADELRAYFANVGVSLEAVVETAREAAEKTVSPELQKTNRELFQVLLNLIAPVVAEEANKKGIDLNQAAFRMEIERRVASLERFISEGRIKLEGSGIALLTTSGDVNKRKTITLAALPILVRLARPEQSVVFAGPNAQEIKAAVLAKENGLTALEKASRVVRFVPGSTRASFAQVIQDSRNKRKSVVSSVANQERSEIEDVIHKILSMIEDVNEINNVSSSSEGVAEAAEAYAVRALLLIGLASYVKAEKIKEPNIAALIRKYFEKNGFDVEVNAKDNTFILTLAQVVKYLSILRAAEQARAKAA